jgi:peptidoglycan/LPS O-acetylase OafA/YrhL
MLRGVACLLVVFFHLGYLFWASNGTVSAAAHVTPLADVPRPAFFDSYAALERHHLSGGPFGVALFFLVSGFVIPFSLDRIDWKRFLVQRAFRLVPTYTTGLALGCLAMAWYAHGHGRPGPISWREYLVNVSLLRPWTSVSSLDGVNWTLELEVQFYALCALLAAAATLRRASALWLAALALTFLGYLTGGAYEPLMQNSPRLFRAAFAVGMSSVYLPYMLVGTCFYNHFRRRWPGLKLVVVAGGLYAVFLLNRGQFPMGSEWSRTVAVNYTLALGVFAACYLLRDRIPRLRVLDAAAAVSYPLYVVHGPGAYVLLTVLCEHGVGALGALTITVPAVLAAAWLLHWLVELPSQRLGKSASGSWLAAEILGPPPPTAVEAPAGRPGYRVRVA